ncbi:hypothetical protein IEQ11_07245 [Lysobacter capsici]|uniref:hypothetical protein n=1 Tax=Lysobacter capsici TaxID=435897 RepID=UPI00177F337F|nr:hypothetical protein [Lysobacter capsici]UOF17642.1 hypothetical protein IEQ11_07245 [Lysobacter capsici]
MLELIALLMLLIAPAAGGALAARLWSSRAPRAGHVGLAVGQIPVTLRRRRVMAVRRGVTA